MPWPTRMLVRSCHQPAQRQVTYPGAETPKILEYSVLTLRSWDLIKRTEPKSARIVSSQHQFTFRGSAAVVLVLAFPHATFQPSLPLRCIHILLKNTPIARLFTLTTKGNFANTNGKAKALMWRRTKQREVWLNNEHYGSRSRASGHQTAENFKLIVLIRVLPHVCGCRQILV